MAAVNGVATFSGLAADTFGGWTMAASDGALTGATSSSFAISPAAAAQVAFKQQPTQTRTGVAVSPAVTVVVQDAFGNTVTTNTSSVTLTLSSGTFSSGSGTVTIAAVNGLATFSSLVINTPGGYTLSAGDGSLTGGDLVGIPGRCAPRSAVD